MISLVKYGPKIKQKFNEIRTPTILAMKYV